jgi:hypothetical protein
MYFPSLGCLFGILFSPSLFTQHVKLRNLRLCRGERVVDHFFIFVCIYIRGISFLQCMDVEEFVNERAKKALNY